MIFYHVSFDMEEKENPYLFIPRIPIFKATSEDAITPRICLSTSVENCIQAISPANRDIRVWAKFRLFHVDIDIKDPLLKDPKSIVDKVPDAVVNNEYWYMGNLYMKYEDKIITEFRVHPEINFDLISKEDMHSVLSEILPEEIACMLDFGKTPKSIYMDLNKLLLDSPLKRKKFLLIDDIDNRLTELPFVGFNAIDKIEYI